MDGHGVEPGLKFRRKEPRRVEEKGALVKFTALLALASSAGTALAQGST